MAYPSGFPSASRAAVAAEKLRAGIDYDEARKNIPWSRYGAGADLMPELRKYILRQFEMFVREACRLGHSGTWDVDRVKKEALEFLRISTIEAISNKGYDKAGRRFGENWISHWDGSIQPETMRQFERSTQWQEFQKALLKVAESQAADADGAVVGRSPEGTFNPRQSTSTDGVDAESHPSKNSNITSLGRNLEKLRLESGWSFDELAAASGLDKKLILGHINKGKSAYPTTLATYAKTFTEKLQRRVTVADLQG